MAKVKTAASSDSLIRKTNRPADTPEAREKQLISLAVDRAEQQLRDGTASAQVITHYLKLGTTYANLEREKLEAEVALLKAKKEACDAAKNTEEMYTKAIEAMKRYSGNLMNDDY